MKAISSVTIVATFGLISSYQISKRVEKNGWKQIQENVQKPINTYTKELKENNSYFSRPMIEKELNKQLQSTNNNSLIISGCKHFGKTTMIKNAFNHNNLPYIYLDFHNQKLDDSNTFISIFEDNMNYPKWYRYLMRKLHPNYNNYLIKHWIDSIQTLSWEIQTENDNIKNDKSEHIKSKQHIPWIIIDGIDLRDIIDNDKLKNDINLLNQQLCKDYEATSIIVSISSKSPMQSIKIFNNLNGWNNNVWIEQFENRNIALEYIKSKLEFLDKNKAISESNMHSIVDFCRLNIDDINFCIDKLCTAFMTIHSDVTKKTFDDIWNNIKEERLSFYMQQQPLLQWKDNNFWKGFMNEMNNNTDEISKEFELNSCKWLLYDYFTSVVIVGSTAFDLIQHFSGNKHIVNILYENGCFSQYGSFIIEPFQLFDKSVLMPSSHPKYKAFKQIFEDNKILSDMSLFVTRHYIFNRELNRAQNDIDRIKADIEIFNAALSYVEAQKKELNEQQRAHLEIDLLNKNKAFHTKLNEANRRYMYFENAKMDNIEKFKQIVDCTQTFV